ncbi:hypothetical protein EK21DRAFT_79954 [Setomelanomma holmii]|uniref:Letm1 RBD domain-containing protein n=1 Tax=Setomelanomma holmii TaxID=210430 RepID=A0A9P4LEZ8_9PLEO|nr:hypothetical protein EK21DRAFT_79954 [Setomelanomma holmii]
MKPRPTISTLAFAVHSRNSTTLLHRRNAHLQAIAPAFSCQILQNGSRRSIKGEAHAKSWKSHTGQRASTAAAVAPKSQYGREPPPPAKARKTSPPTKPMPASKTTAPAKTFSIPAIPILKTKEHLNPPPFTYAPDLTVPARGADQGFLSYIWKAGSSYLSFYKTGVSNVRQTSKLARSLRDKATKAGKEQSEVLSRAEWQIVGRSRKDMLRLPAFGAIFLVFGEWTPLLVMYITPLIPEACRIPSQVQKDLAKTEKKRHERLRRAGVDSMRLLAKDRTSTSPESASSLSSAASIRHADALKLPFHDLILASARFDCHSKIWDWMFVTPPKFWLQRTVRKKFAYLKTDDELIERDGGCQALSKREVERSCIERGIDVIGKKEEELRRALGAWFKG